MVTEGPLWPLQSILTYHWDSLNKKEGLGGWASGNFGDSVCIRPDHFVPPHLHGCCHVSPRKKNGIEEGVQKLSRKPFQVALIVLTEV